MSAIPQLGKRLILILGVSALCGILIQLVNFAQMPALPKFVPADHYNTWQRGPAPRLPGMNTLRGNPAAYYFTYQSPDQPVIYVSIARADTLDAYRAPYHYLLDEDGRVIGGNQETYQTRAYDDRPVRILYAMEGRSDNFLVMHWTQAPGEAPILDPADATGKIFGALLTKKPVYVCDAWIPVSGNENFNLLSGSLSFLTDAIDRHLQAMPRE